MKPTEPLRGEIWMVELDPTRGHEQAGTRPALVVSADLFNQGPADLVVAVPITSKEKGIPFHVRIDPPQGGLKVRSFIKCEDIRSISKSRMSRRLGALDEDKMREVETRMRILLVL